MISIMRPKAAPAVSGHGEPGLARHESAAHRAACAVPPRPHRAVIATQKPVGALALLRVIASKVIVDEDRRAKISQSLQQPNRQSGPTVKARLKMSTPPNDLVIASITSN